MKIQPTVDVALDNLRRAVDHERTEAIRARLTAFWGEAGTPVEPLNGKPKRKYRLSPAGRAKRLAANRRMWKKRKAAGRKS